MEKNHMIPAKLLLISSNVIMLLLCLQMESPDSLKGCAKVFKQKYGICNLPGKGSTKNLYDKANVVKYLLSLHGGKTVIRLFYFFHFYVSQIFHSKL